MPEEIFSSQVADGVDPKLEELLSPAATQRVAVIRTSDRMNFKRCRRRWAWQSHLRGNLGTRDTFGALWFGTGIHYALEDFHGHNVYGTPAKSFAAYAHATAAISHLQAMPPDLDDLLPLGENMMNYYSSYWLRNRSPLQTYVHNGVPQVEVNAIVEIDINLFPRWLRQYYDRILYSATFDRVIIDGDGLLWLVDYKTTKRMATLHFSGDPQISAYCWLGQHLYGQPIAGMIYQQHRKEIVVPPKLLVTGKLSVNKQQATSHSLYRTSLQQIYGESIDRWPAANVDFLNWLAGEEGPTADHFIRRDRVERNISTHQSTGTLILMEIEEMLDPTLPLYPNPTRDCAFMCPFLTACTSIDDGGDYQAELDMFFHPRPRSQESWRPYLPAQPQLLSPPLQHLLPPQLSPT